jgi:hypothetical protein
MRYLISNQKYRSDKWIIVKIFTLIPRKCYDADADAYFIVWLEYINVVYEKLGGENGKFFFNEYRTINN